jgi:fibrillarin-like rRNA methylase
VFEREIETLRGFEFYPSEKITLEPYEVDHAVVAGSYRVKDEDS